MKLHCTLRPTMHAVLLFAASVAAAFIVLAIDPTLWAFSFDFGLLVLAAVIVDAALGLPARSLTLGVQLPPRLYVGASGDMAVEIVRAGPPKPVPLQLLAEWRGEADPAVVVPIRLEPGMVTLAHLPMRAQRRGRIDVDAVWLRWQGPLGLSERVVRQPVDKAIDVLPDVRGIESAALQFFARDAINGVKVQNQKGDGAEFESLRDHVPGLDNRFIDWKRSAKHRKLLSKEFRIERNHQIMLAFDTGHLMLEPIKGLARLDHAINSGLLLAWICLRNGDQVGTFGFDGRVRHYLQPARGMAWFTRLQRGTAQLAYRTEETNFTLGLAELNVRLKRRALIVLFTEFIDTTTAQLLVESLQRMSNRHAIVFVTLRDPLLGDLVDAHPDSFRQVAEAVVAQDFARERAIVLERLERMGVHCLDVNAAGLSVALVNRYLKIKERGLI